MRQSKLRGVLQVLALILLVAGSVSAAVELRYSPADQTLPPGSPGFLAIMLDDAIEVRTLDFRLSYDPAILLSVGGGPGQLFTEAGCQLFLDSNNSTPGEYYGAVVIIGAGCWITDPGELYVWNFETIGEGTSPVITLSVRLFDAAANLIADVTLPDTHVFVGDDTAVEEPPARALRLALFPNPFNPGVSLSLGGAEGPASLDVLDVRGRHLKRVWWGDLSASPLVLRWDGRDAAGRAMPSGVYLFRLALADGSEQVRRGVLIE